MIGKLLIGKLEVTELRPQMGSGGRDRWRVNLKIPFVLEGNSFTYSDEEIKRRSWLAFNYYQNKKHWPMAAGVGQYDLNVVGTDLYITIDYCDRKVMEFYLDK